MEEEKKEDGFDFFEESVFEKEHKNKDDEKKIKKIMNLIFSMNLYQKNNEYYKNSLAQKHEVKYHKNTK